MNSPQSLNYETRPCKFVERCMLLLSLQRICNKFVGGYQYVGFGGVSFTDFKLFHKGLHIDSMHSIEGGSFHKKKLEYNKPYSFIKIHQVLSSEALNRIPLTNKTLIWLDYDGVLETYMFDDLRIVLSVLPAGSIYIMTCNRELKSKEDPTEDSTPEEFKEKFGQLSPFKLTQKDLSSKSNYKTIRKMFLMQIDDIIRNRVQNKEDISFTQLFDIIYSENRGARMYTFGGIIMPDDKNLASLDLSDFDFIYNGSDEAFKIEVPNITHLEEILINKHIGLPGDLDEELEDIVKVTDYNKYLSIHKYYPNFVNANI